MVAARTTPRATSAVRHGVALVLSLAAGAGPAGVIHGWDLTALVSAVPCAIGALIVGSCPPRA